jgi:hypothetical protein
MDPVNVSAGFTLSMRGTTAWHFYAPEVPKPRHQKTGRQLFSRKKLISIEDLSTISKPDNPGFTIS